MSRLLSVCGAVLLGTVSAQAQQVAAQLRLQPSLPDSLTLRPVADSARVAFPETVTPPFTTLLPVLSRVAGVQVSSYSGEPGAWAAVRIRGVATVTGYSQPLYVVDDVPVYNSDITPEVWQSGRDFLRQPQGTATGSAVPYLPGGNPLLDLPVADIETVEVLKGAAATARYGLQGGNGVVRISTRRGADGRATAQPLRVRYTGYAAVQQVRQRYELLGATDYARIANQAAANDRYPNPVVTPEQLAARGSADWQDRLFRTAFAHSHDVGVDGRTGAMRYYVGADYLHQGGVLDGSWLNRYHLRTNLDQQIGRKLVLGLNASGTELRQRQPGLTPETLIQQTLLTVPLGTTYDAQGRPTTNDPEQTLRRGGHAPRTRRLLAQLWATYQVLPELTLCLRGSREVMTMRDNLTLTPYSPPYINQTSTLTETNTIDVGNWVAAADLTYRHTIGTRHALSAGLHYLRQQADQEWASSQVTDFGGGGRSESRYFRSVEYLPLQSPSATVGYVFDGRYEVQASVRADHIGKAPQDTTLWYPGAQLRWHLGREAFMARVPGLSAATLYVGVGRTSGSVYSLGGLTRSSYFPSRLDRTQQVDAGLETSWLQRRLLVAASVYQRLTRQAEAQLYSNGISPDVTLRSRGLELTTTGTWQLGRLTGSTSVAASANLIRVEDLTEYYSGYSSLVRTPVESIPRFGLSNGQPVGFFLYEQDGIYPAGTAQAGQVRYRDVDQDGRISIGDAQPYGNRLPRYALNVYQQLRHRRLQLDMQLDGLFGYQIYNATLATLDLPNGTGRNFSAQALNYWTPANPNTTVPAPALAGQYNYPTRNQLASGNHLRLTQLQLSYAVLQTSRRQLSVWVGGQNLFVTGSYRGYDPNISSGGASPLVASRDIGVYPTARVWQLGVRGQF